MQRAQVRRLVPIAALLTSLAQSGDGVAQIAFEYSPRLTPQQLDWYARFEVLVTHDPLPPDQVAYLRQRGTRLALYEWSVAFYSSLARPGSWHDTLVRERRDALLNDMALRGGLGSPIADAYYYDPASTIHQKERAAEIAARLKASGYDGVFLDTTTEQSVHPDALAAYRQRHPDLPYDAAFSKFMVALRRALPRGVIITNQGYRAARRYLPYANWDVSESLITTSRGDGFAFRPWNDPADPWNSIVHLMRTLIAPAHRRHPRVRFAHLNYLDAPDHAQTMTIAAIARLFDADAFVTHPSITGAPIDDSLLLPVGRAVGPVVDRGLTRYRWFSKALVAVNASKAPLSIPNRKRERLLNPLTGEVSNSTIVIPPAAGSGLNGVILRRAR